MPTPGNGVDGEYYGSPQYNTGIAAYPRQPVLQLQTVPVAPYPIQQHHEPPPAYETISQLPPLCANSVNSQFKVTPSAPVAPHDVSFYAPALPYPHNGFQVHGPANAQQWNVQPTTTFNNIPYSNPTTNNLYVANTQNSSGLMSQNTVLRNQTRGRFPFPGIVMILSAIVHIGFGIGVASNLHGRRSTTISCGIPFWAAILHIITGSVSAAARLSPPRCKISTALILTAGTLIICVIDLALNIMDFNDASDCFMNISDFWGSSHVCFRASPLYWGLIATNGFILFFSVIFICLGCSILSSGQ